MAELADALDSGSNGRKAVQVQVLLPAPNWNASIDTILAFLSFSQKSLGASVLSAFANEIRFIVSKLTTQKSKLSDSNLPIFHTHKSL